MKRPTSRLAIAGATLVLAAVVATGSAFSASGGARSALGPVDTYFVTETSLGTPFQTESGRLAQKKGGTPAIRSYAELMVSSHIAVDDALGAILKRKAEIPPPTLLKAAYATTISTLAEESGERFDAAYVRDQVKYQRANAGLYRYEIDNGTDPDLKDFARQTLPKILDHLKRALKLERELSAAAGGADQCAPATADMPKAELLHDGDAKTYLLAFRTGQPVVKGLMAFAREHRIEAGRLTGIGAVRDASFGDFDLQKQDYRRNHEKGEVEVLSLTGNLALFDEEPRSHLHVTLGREDGTAFGGNLFEMTASPMVEVVLTTYPSPVRRQTDRETGPRLLVP